MALDDATLENGCLCFGEGTNLGPVYAHEAPADEPYNLQLPAGDPEAATDGTGAGAARWRVLPPRQHLPPSGPNLSTRWRRACALHYVRNDVEFAKPALPYDHALKMRVT